MEKSFNLQVVESKEKILKAINETKLPAIVLQMILKEISSAVDMQVQNLIQQEKKEFYKENKDKQNVDH